MQAEKILSKLTGGQLVDRNYLVEMITKYGRTEKDAKEVAKLGKKLYSILISNGLNESSEIDPLRLLEKADNYLYGDRVKNAIEILKVLESQEHWALEYDKLPVYYFNNNIEAKRYEQISKKEFCWLPSLKNQILSMLVLAYIEDENLKEAEKTFEFYKKLNPTGFDVFALEIKLLKEKKSSGLIDAIKNAFNYGYTSGQYAELYSELAYIYEEKDDLKTAFALLTLAKEYSSSLSIEKHFKTLNQLFTNSGVKKPKISYNDCANIVQELGYPLLITEDMFASVTEGYVDYLKGKNVTLEGKDFYRAIISSITGDDNFAYDLEDLAKEKN